MFLSQNSNLFDYQNCKKTNSPSIKFITLNRNKFYYIEEKTNFIQKNQI